MSEAEKTIAQKTAIRELWRRGNLDFILHPKQKLIKADLLSRVKDISTVLCARRFGKTYLLLCMGTEVCINKPFAIIKYVCPEMKQGTRNIKENMRNILIGCPDDLKPIWYENDKKWLFPNGSEIQVAGTDNGSHESLRGGSADMCIVDEAGFCDHLAYVVYEVLGPTIDLTGGKIYLISTPSKRFNHEFIQNFLLPAQQDGTLTKYTIYDNPRLTPLQVEKIIARRPLREKDPGFMREYLCEIQNDQDTTVIPEATQSKMLEIVGEHPFPAFYDAYTSGDVGFKDLTVYLFGYWDFLKATLVIVDELVMNGPEMTTDKLAEGIRQKEATNFRGVVDGITKPVYLRIMDNNLIMMNDLNRLHKMNFMATSKDNKEAQINHVRQMVANNQIKIHPRCKHLIYHLQNAMWKASANKNREFDRLADTQDKSVRGGHADALDALIYLVRNIVRSKNPYPRDYAVKTGDDVFNSKLYKAPADDSITNAFKNMLNVKRLVPKRK